MKLQAGKLYPAVCMPRTATLCPMCRTKVWRNREQQRRWCPGCGRAYDLESGRQIEHGAWVRVGPDTFRFMPER